MALLAGGHALLVGVPGLAKTLLISSLAAGHAARVPPDPVHARPGAERHHRDRDHGGGRRHRHRGRSASSGGRCSPTSCWPTRSTAPRRAPRPRCWRRCRSTGSRPPARSMPLPEPFFVLATQNPIEQEGTYPLPEAQLDRFLFDIRIGYPAEAEEIEILRSTTGATPGAAGPGARRRRDARAAAGHAGRCPPRDPALRYAAALARATRPDEPTAPDLVKRYVRWGAGPRAGQALILGAKAHAMLQAACPLSRPRTSAGWRTPCCGTGSCRISRGRPRAWGPSGSSGRCWIRWRRRGGRFGCEWRGSLPGRPCNCSTQRTQGTPGVTEEGLWAWSAAPLVSAQEDSSGRG